MIQMAFCRRGPFLLKSCSLSGGSMSCTPRGRSTSRMVCRALSTIGRPSSPGVVCRFSPGKLRHSRVHFSQQGATRIPEVVQGSSGKQASSAEPSPGDESEPVRYSTSGASAWSVDDSFGRRKRKPLTMVIPVCLTTLLILVWAAFRSESELDEKLESALNVTMPEKFREEELKQFQPLSDWTKPHKKDNQENN